MQFFKTFGIFSSFTNKFLSLRSRGGKGGNVKKGENGQSEIYKMGCALKMRVSTIVKIQMRIKRRATKPTRQKSLVSKCTRQRGQIVAERRKGHMSAQSNELALERIFLMLSMCVHKGAFMCVNEYMCIPQHACAGKNGILFDLAFTFHTI